MSASHDVNKSGCQNVIILGHGDFTISGSQHHFLEIAEVQDIGVKSRIHNLLNKMVSARIVGLVNLAKTIPAMHA